MIRRIFIWGFILTAGWFYILIAANYKNNPKWEFAQTAGNFWNEWIWPIICWVLLIVFITWIFFKVRGRVSSEPTTGNPVSSLIRPYWRKYRRYKSRWKSAMILCDLYKLAGWQGKEKCTPRFSKIRSNGYLDLVRVRPIMGMSQRDFEMASDKLAMAFGARSCRVKSDPKAGYIWLEFEISDALAKKLPALPIPETVDLENVAIGIGENGEPWTINVIKKHIFLAGIQGAGKSSLLHAMLRGLGPAIRDGSVEIRLIDPKGGMEFSSIEPLCTHYEDEDYERMVELAEQTVKDMKASSQMYAAQKTRKWTPSSDEPLVILVVDEFATLTNYMPDKGLRERFEKAAGIILTQGRGPGFRIWAAAQDPRMEVVKYRHLFPIKMALELDKPEQVNWVLGEGMRAKGALADKISQPGIVYVKDETRKEPERKLVAFVDDPDIEELVEKCPRPRVKSQEIGEDGIVIL